MARYVELRRHTDADGDVLTQEGVRAATEIGARLRGGYDLLVSTGAQRATQTLACFLATLGERVAGGVIVETDLRSGSEDRWREAYEKAGSGELEALRNADPELVEEADRVHDADVDRAPALAALDHERVEGDVRVGAPVERAGAEVLDDLVEALRQA